jgi:acyl-homoserine lactone acylase PvdQ
VPRRAVLVVACLALSLAGGPSAVAADNAETALNILPSGQYQTPGPGADRQARMYDALTPRFDRVTDADLPTYFKSEALEPSTVVSTETVPGRPGVLIKRDEYKVPHVYGQTDDDVVFGAGWVIAGDQSLLLNQARFNGLLAAIDAPNLSAIDLIKNLYQFQPSRQTNDIVARQSEEIRKAGPRGEQLLRDIDTYLAGMNAWVAAKSPSTPRYTRNDIFALNAIKAQFLAQGGGKEPESSQLLNGLQRRLGGARGLGAWEDLRNRDDPETTTTLPDPAPYDTATGSRRGTVTLRNGSYKPLGGLPPTPSTPSSRRAESSNILMVSGRRSATGRPLFVGGPQVKYFFPGLVTEIGLHGPDIDVRGATSAPFPGYMLIGRGESFAWTITSTDGDIIDSYAETLCGGSRTSYLYRGRCRAMTRVDAGTLNTPDGSSIPVRFYRTVHGPVTGYAKTVKGGTVAISRKRSSYGKDTVDQLFFQQLTFGRVKSFRDFAKAAALTPQTFNAFYADNRTTGLYTTGALPLRPRGADGSLVTDGRGGFEWKGLLAASKHPQGTIASGLLVNWNNRPAPGFVGGDDLFGQEGPVQRDDMLLRELSRKRRHTLGSVVGAMNAAATEDVRGRIFWPTMRAVLARSRAPSARAKLMVAMLDAWSARRAARLDRDGDGKLDDPGVEIMDSMWNAVADAALCGPIGKALCAQLASSGLQKRWNAPQDGENMYEGWYHYMDKDFRSLLGRPVRQPFSMGYCGRGKLARCAAALWRAIDRTGAQLAAKLGPDPSTWLEPASEQQIKFTPLPLITMAYTNRPSGIQQVISFKGSR